MRYYVILMDDDSAYIEDFSHSCRESICLYVSAARYNKALVKVIKYYKVKNLEKKLNNISSFLNELNIKTGIHDKYIVIESKHKIPVSLALLLYRRYLRLFDKKQTLDTFVKYLLKKSYRPELGELADIISFIYFMYNLKFNEKYSEPSTYHNGPISLGYLLMKTTDLEQDHFFDFICDYLNEEHLMKIRCYIDNKHVGKFFEKILDSWR